MAFPIHIVQRADAQLKRLEDSQLAEVTRYLSRAQTDLERELRVLYTRAQTEGMTESIAWRQTRARMLLEQTEAALQKFDTTGSRTVNGALKTLVGEAQALGHESAMEFMQGFVPSKVQGLTAAQSSAMKAAFNTVDIRLESIANAAKNAAARLHRYSAEQILRMNDIVLSGLVRGQGWAKTANELRASTGMLDYQAERIVRTESVSNNDNARRERYQDYGIEFVQRLATQDDRVCEYCAERAGKVYKIDEAPAVLHPNDRCYNLPWSPDLAEYDDPEFWETHRKDIEDRLKEEGRKPNSGLAPFERLNELVKPEAIWTPGGGYTEAGISLLGPASAAVQFFKGFMVDMPTPGNIAPALPKPKTPKPKAPKPAKLTEPVTVEDLAQPAPLKPPEPPPWTPLDETEAIRATRAYSSEIAQTGVRTQVDALKRYTGNQYTVINGYLRGKHDPRALASSIASIEGTVKNIDKLFTSQIAVLRQDMRLWRGYNLHPSRLPAGGDPSKMAGTVMRDAAIQSTTVSKDTAYSFAAGGSSSDKVSVIMEIQARAGQRGIPVSSFSNYAGEHEVVVPRGTSYMIKSAAYEGEGSRRFLRLVVEMIQQ